MVGGGNKPVLKLRDMEEKHLHNLFLKNMSGLIEEVKNPTPRLNPNSKCGGMATHAGLALELGIINILCNLTSHTIARRAEGLAGCKQCPPLCLDGVDETRHCLNPPEQPHRLLGKTCPATRRVCVA